MMLPKSPILAVIRRALAEDRARDDVTSRTILPATLRIQARIVAKASGILAGGPVAAWTFHACDPSLRVAIQRREGRPLARGHTILVIEGRAQPILAAERTALNVMGHLCGIATLTAAFVRQVRGTRAMIYDTRKTLPGLRILEKYAVRVGGGHNHRSDLSEAILIKTNHVLACSVQRTADSEKIRQLIVEAKRKAKGKFIEVEVQNFSEFKAALEAKPHAILLDNWPIGSIRRAMRFLHPGRSTLNARPLIEVSGGVTLDNVRAVAKTGVDRISIGRLTHSAPSLDVSLKILGA
jgi:nicotinate-nucleotide pyrophosphorylase (carboxylating)